VYKAVLDEWARGARGAINVVIVTDSFDLAGGVSHCFKGHVFEIVVPKLAHRIREQDLAALEPHKIHLVDSEAYAREIDANDPQNGMRPGATDRDIKDSVDNAFEHGLFSFGEIQFDTTHAYAMVSYGFRCGELCGHGDTLLMKKTDGNGGR
jgi:hypothetical protein